MVVIAVVAILVGLLLPALSAAKEKGRMISYYNNMRQFGLGMFMYADDSRDTLPWACSTTSRRFMPKHYAPKNALATTDWGLARGAETWLD